MKRPFSFSFLPRLGGRRASFKIGVIATLAIAVAANIAVLGNLGVLFGNVIPGASHNNLLEPHLQALEATVNASEFGVFRPVYDRLAASLDGRAETALYQQKWAKIGKGAHQSDAPFLYVTPSLSKVLGVRVIAGRGLSSADSAVGAVPVMVVSDSVARVRFGSAQAAVGQMLMFGGKPYRIVGVHSSALRFPSSSVTPAKVKAWLPFPPESENVKKDLYPNRGTFAVVRPGSSVSAATIKAALARAYRQALPGYSTYMQRQLKQMHFVPRVTSLAQREYGPIIKRLQLLELAALLLIVLVFANLAGLATSDALARRHEIATRVALGAGTFRLFIERLCELGTLGLVAWAIGIGLGWLGHRALATAIGQAGGAVALSLPVLGLTLVGVLVIVTIISLPGLRRIRAPRNLLADLMSGGRASGGRGLTRALRVFIVVQIAASAVLLVVAGNLHANVFSLTHHDLGFETNQRAFVRVRPPGPQNCNGKACEAIGKRDTLFARRLLERLNRRVDIQGVAQVGRIPFSGGESTTSAGLLPNSSKKARHRKINIQRVSKGVTQALGLHVLAGDPRDLFTGSGNAVVIDAAAASFYWPGVSLDQIVGRSLYVDISGNNGKPQRVAAVIAPLRMKAFGSIGGTIFVSTANHAVYNALFVVHGTIGMTDLRKTVKHAVEATNPQAKLQRFVPAAQLVAQAYAQRSQLGRVFGVLAVVALLIAAIGLFALLAYRSLVRRPEFAIRGALGATPSRLLRNVLGEAGALWIVGCVIGVPAAYGLSIVLASYLPKLGLPATWVTIAVVVALGITALIAALVPARRAAGTDLSGNLSA